MNVEIKVSESAGFCAGVRRAFDIAVTAARKHGRAYTIGELVHNADALRLLREQGVYSASSVHEVSEESAKYFSSGTGGSKGTSPLSGGLGTEPPSAPAVVIRSHGVGKDVYSAIARELPDYPLYDATCPFVKRIHAIAEEYSGLGFAVVIAGDKLHPEVQGIVGHIVGDSGKYVVGSEEQLREVLAGFSPERNAVFVAQTTFNKEIWCKFRKIIKKHCTNAKIFDTICNATVERQSYADKLSKECCAVVVIGSAESSNSLKLYEICRKNCPMTVFIENADDERFGRVLKDIRECVRSCSGKISGGANPRKPLIGITAGASVPAEIIKEVHGIMNDEKKKVQGVDTDSGIDFMAEIDKSMPAKIYTGKRVKAYVISVNSNEVVVDLGTKHSGYIPADEFPRSGESQVSPGDEVECVVTKVNDAEGVVYLSKKQIDSEVGYGKLAEAFESGEVLEGFVSAVVNSGVIVMYEGTRVFIPASHSTIPKTGKLEELLKKTVKFKVIEVGEQRKRVVGSIRNAARGENDAIRAKFWESIEVGKKYKGEVKSMESYGVFVDLGGIDGMVHLSELTWKRVRHPKEVVQIGTELEVVVKSFDKEKRRISLTAKNPDENPWAKFAAEYKPGMVVTARVVNITPFGAFAEIIPGVDGLIHISQISKERVNNVAHVLSINQEIEVKITEIDIEKERVSISARAVNEPDTVDVEVQDAE